MARSRKDGRRGGGHKSLNLKRKAIGDRRRTSKQIEFEAVEKHFQSDELSFLYEWGFHGHITRALKRVPVEFLSKFLENIADKSYLLTYYTDIFDFDDSGAGWIWGIFDLVEDKESWIRPIETWCVETHFRHNQFSELFRHLLAAYDVPRFMDKAWFYYRDRVGFHRNPVHLRWFKHIAAGQNIRTAAGLPFVLTKKMAHHFLTAPEDYTINEALRWGQVHALGGNRHLAEALRGTYLVSALDTNDTDPRDFWFVEDDFWISVIRFFIQNPRLNTRHISPIIDYIRHQKYGDPQRNIEPAHPNFSMKGRTPEALLREVEAWHQELYRPAEKEMRRCRWKGAGIGAFRFQQGSRTWDIMELTNEAELYTEGKDMRHCVRTYLRLCMSGETSIWAMAIKDEGETVWKKAVTIAVDPRSRQITEVRGRSNRLPTQEEKSILERWAAKENLEIPSYIRIDCQ